MRLKQSILSLIFIAYALSIAHSVLPHQHTDSHRESSSEQGGHDHRDSDDPKHDNGLTFPVHFSNTDVSFSKFTFEQKVKVKNDLDIIQLEKVHLPADVYSLTKVFHVPIGLLWNEQRIISSCGLRAPPFLS